MWLNCSIEIKVRSRGDLLLPGKQKPHKSTDSLLLFSLLFSFVEVILHIASLPPQSWALPFHCLRWLLHHILNTAALYEQTGSWTAFPERLSNFILNSSLCCPSATACLPRFNNWSQIFLQLPQHRISTIILWQRYAPERDRQNPSKAETKPQTESVVTDIDAATATCRWVDPQATESGLCTPLDEREGFSYHVVH